MFGAVEKAGLWHHHGDMGGQCVCGPDGSLRFTVSFHVAYFFCLVL